MKRSTNKLRLATRAMLASAVAAVALHSAGGCRSAEDREAEAAAELSREEAARELDAGLVRAIRDPAVDNAIITQHTLYPYHFVTGGSTLNELGQHDVAVLAEHYRTLGNGATASLSLRRGGASDALYDARVKAVTGELARAGIKGDGVEINNAVAGGDGIRGQRLTTVMQRDRENKSYYGEEENGSIIELIGKSSGGSTGNTGAK